MMLTVNAVNQYDPTRTLGLRNSFARELTKRFKNLIASIRHTIVVDDVFGFSPDTLAKATISSPGKGAFKYPALKDQLTAFMDWVNSQIEKGILETRAGVGLTRAVEVLWTNYYVRLAYEQGIGRARQELLRARYRVPSVENSGGINNIIYQPMHQDRLGVLYSRTYVELKGVTDAMSQQINRVLSQAMTQGKTANQIARLLVRTIGGPALELTDTLGRFIPALQRAQLIARTELVRAHASALVQEYRNWGAVGVKVEAEFMTAGDERVCPECAALEGQIFSLDEIDGMIPIHPACRCMILPVTKT